MTLENKLIVLANNNFHNRADNRAITSNWIQIQTRQSRAYREYTNFHKYK